MAALNKIMIANMIRFETCGEGVSKIALLGKGEELLLTDNTFLQWQARIKTQIMPRKNTERIKKNRRSKHFNLNMQAPLSS